MPKRWKWKRLLAGLALGAVVVWLAANFAAAYLFLHPPKLPLARTPAALGIRFEKVTFRSSDGVRLRGWFVPRPKARGTILLCHGYPGNRADLLSYIGFLHRGGFQVLAFDFRALGESGGAMSTIGYREVGDALGAVAYLKARRDTKHLPVGILGTSMGGAVALQAASLSPDLRAVVADSPYARLDRAVDQRFRAYGGASGVALSLPAQWFGGQMLGANTAAVAPVDGMARISPRPLLLIYGSKDRWILPEDSRLLYEAARAPKEAWKIEGAGHVGGYAVAGQAYEERILGFFQKAFSRPANAAR